MKTWVKRFDGKSLLAKRVTGFEFCVNSFEFCVSSIEKSVAALWNVWKQSWKTVIHPGLTPNSLPKSHHYNSTSLPPCSCLMEHKSWWGVEVKRWSQGEKLMSEIRLLNSLIIRKRLQYDRSLSEPHRERFKASYGAAGGQSQLFLSQYAVLLWQPAVNTLLSIMQPPISLYPRPTHGGSSADHAELQSTLPNRVPILF